jgi:hypothetical protein
MCAGRADGRLLAVCYAGYGHIAMPDARLPKGGRLSGCFLDDEGKNWSAAFTLFDGPYDDRDPSVARLKDGRLACTFFTLKPRATGRRDMNRWRFHRDQQRQRQNVESEPRLITKAYYVRRRSVNSRMDGWPWGSTRKTKSGLGGA